MPLLCSRKACLIQPSSAASERVFSIKILPAPSNHNGVPQPDHPLVSQTTSSPHKSGSNDLCNLTTPSFHRPHPLHTHTGLGLGDSMQLSWNFTSVFPYDWITLSHACTSDRGYSIKISPAGVSVTLKESWLCREH